MSQNQTRLTTPNLPGMRPNQHTWVMRSVRSGFKKAPSRPGSAQPIGRGSLGDFFANTEELPRPGTAGKDFHEVQGGISFTNLNQSQGRPDTAGLSRSMPNFTGTDFDPYKEERNGYGSHSRPTSASSQLPKFVSNDKKVCRFYAHFQQKRNWEKTAPLGQPVVEKEITRFLTIMYYLVDDEIEIYEPRVVNSGMNNGKFFRKGKLLKEDGTRLELTELFPGAKIDVLGQRIYITDADKFTRQYFETELGVEMAAALPRPKQIRGDIGAQYATGMGSQALPTSKKSFGTRSTDYLAIKEIKDKTNRYLRYDGRVLRFQCVEVKGNSPPFFPALQAKAAQQGYYGQVASADVRRFALAYYLSTSNIELVVQRPPPGAPKDVGQDEPRLILKKSKLPKNWREAQRGRPAQFYEPEDFRCGDVIDVYGRRFLLVNCDKFTRQVYKELGTEQQDVMLVKEDRPAIVQPTPQLGDGFLAIGSEADTLSTVYGMPKPGKDIEKISRNQNRLIRCKAIMLTNSPIDQSREFLITFYLEDDTVQVYEEARRNSGIWGGTYLKRGKYINDLPNDTAMPRHFKPTDIYLGNVISFHGSEFQIVEMDNHSLLFCENYPAEFPMCDTFKIIGNMMFKILEMRVDIRPSLRKHDPQGHKYLPLDQFVHGLDELSLSHSLNDQELLTLVRRFKDDDDDIYHYEELADLISHVYHRTHNEQQSDRKFKKSSMDLSNFQTFKSSARLRNIQWRRTLRKDPNTVSGYLTLSILDKLFRKHGYLLADEILDELYLRYRVEDDVAKPILEALHRVHADNEFFDGFDQKIAPKRRDLSASAMNSNGNKYQASLVAHRAAEQRRRQSAVGSVLRRGSETASHTGLEDGSTGGGGDERRQQRVERTKALIDYHKLCDDIYICDWID